MVERAVLNNNYTVVDYDPSVHGANMSVFVSDSTLGHPLLKPAFRYDGNVAKIGTLRDVVVLNTEKKPFVRVLCQCGGTFVTMQEYVKERLGGRIFKTTAATPMGKWHTDLNKPEWEEHVAMQNKHVKPDAWHPTIRSFHKLQAEHFYNKGKNKVHVRPQAFGAFLER